VHHLLKWLLNQFLHLRNTAVLTLSLFYCFSTSVFMQHIFMGLNHTFISVICHTDWLQSVAWISGECIRVSMNDISVWRAHLINFSGNEPFVNQVRCLKRVSRATIERTTERYLILIVWYIILIKIKLQLKYHSFNLNLTLLNDQTNNLSV